MGITYAYSMKNNIDEAVKELYDTLGSGDAKLIVYFASSCYPQEQLSQKMKEVFPKPNVIGCSTSGEIVSGKMLKNSLVAMALDADVVKDCAIGVVKHNQNKEIKEVFEGFETHYGRKMHELEYDRYVGLILLDGLSVAEERIMDSISNKTHVTFVGGSAGDDLAFKQTFVSANGKTWSNATVVALLEPTNGFEILKTQSFRCTPNKFIATKVDEAKREILEFNEKPAIHVYASALGVDPGSLPDKFMSNPVGIVIDEDTNDVFVRSPQQVMEDGIVFYCNVAPGTEVSILESTDIIADTRNAIAEKKNALGSLSGILNFNCILRTLELEKKGLTEAYAELFTDIPTIGLSTYGEAYVGHINQTATMLMFK